MDSPRLGTRSLARPRVAGQQRLGHPARIPRRPRSRCRAVHRSGRRAPPDHQHQAPSPPRQDPRRHATPTASGGPLVARAHPPWANHTEAARELPVRAAPPRGTARGATPAQPATPGKVARRSARPTPLGARSRPRLGPTAPPRRDPLASRLPAYVHLALDTAWMWARLTGDPARSTQASAAPGLARRGRRSRSPVWPWGNGTGLLRVSPTPDGGGLRASARGADCPGWPIRAGRACSSSVKGPGHPASLLAGPPAGSQPGHRR